MTRFTRANPSPRFSAFRDMHARLHREGERSLGIAAQDTFPGSSLFPHVAAIKRLIDATGTKTVLDYGAGKGQQYRPRPVEFNGARVADSIAEYWDVDEVRCYDPGHAPYATLPEGRFDGVICTDVLEHCPEEDLPWIMEELFGYAVAFVFIGVACYPARKRLPSGENAHVTIRPPEWWRELASACSRTRPELRWELCADYGADGGAKAKAVFRSNDVPPAVGQPLVVSADIEGKKARFLASNEMTRWRVESLYTKEPVTIDWLRSMPKGAVLLDVGANVGMYTVFAAIAREARVYAFEPESQNYATLNANLQLNGLGTLVLAVCAALSDENGIDRLFLAATSAGASCHSLGAEVGFDLKPRPAAFSQGTVALRFDDLVASGRVPVPEFVKIDVDGFEHRVVRGMERTLRGGGVRSLLVELNPALVEHRDIRDYLVSLGYEWDADQVKAATRVAGTFKGVAEHVFRR